MTPAPCCAEEAQCPLCGSITETVLTRTLRRGHGTVFKCEGCDHGFLVAPKVDAKDYYNGAYRERASHRAAESSTVPFEIFEVYSKFQADRLERVLPYLKADSHVLEIGASAGQFLYHLKGKCARRCAIELDDACCHHMRTYHGIEADSNFLGDSMFAKDKFDVVCSFQTLEHVADPIQFLREVRFVLKPGGVAFIEVPSLSDPLLTVFDVPDYVPFYYHSAHLSYFSARSLSSVAKRAGFDDPTIYFSQDYNLLSVIQWAVNNEPLPTCEPGLGPIVLNGKNKEIAGWLSSELRSLNARYIKRLQGIGATSNLMMVLTKE